MGECMLSRSYGARDRAYGYYVFDEAIFASNLVSLRQYH